MRRFDGFLQAVREASDPTRWNRGGALFREQAVRVLDTEPGRYQFQVRTRGGLVSPIVTLAPDEDSWGCDCDFAGEACEHVVAASFALQELPEQVADAPQPVEAVSVVGSIGYRLTVRPQGVAVLRVAVGLAGEQPILASLEAIATGRVEGPWFAARAIDLKIERALGRELAGTVIPRPQLPAVFDALAAAEDLTLDGRPVKVSKESIVPVIAVTQRGSGHELRLVDDPRVTRALSSSVLELGDQLALRGETKLGARDREQLIGGVFVPSERTAWLASEELIRLGRSAPLVIESESLPRAESLPLRTVIQTEREGVALRVRVDLIYGDPPRARIESGRLRMLAPPPVPRRDLAAEERASAAVRRALELDPGAPVLVRDQAAIELARRIARFGGEIEGLAHTQFVAVGELQPWLQFEPELDLRFDRMPAGGARAALSAWQRGEQWVELQGGGFGRLPSDWFARYGAQVSALLEARAHDGALEPALQFQLAELSDALGVERPAAVQRFLDALVETEIASFEPPAAMASTLRPYQIEGARWLYQRGAQRLGALLADDMGLGKTIQSLAVIGPKTLVVAPASVLFQWAGELARFRPELSVCLYHGPDRRLDPAADVTLTSYALLRLDLEPIARQTWEWVILDEAGAIKNADSRTAHACFQLAATRRIALTGTPIENRLSELWSIMRFLNPGVLGSLTQFRTTIEQPISAGDLAVLERLRQRIKPFVLRRHKQAVASELPPRIERVVACELSSEERQVYESVALAARAEALRLAEGGAVLEALEALLRLRQACCHVALVPGAKPLDRPNSAKLDLLEESLTEILAEGHRALVFSQWTSLLDLVEPMLRRCQVAFTRLDGSTVDRAGVVAQFQSESGPPVMLLSLKAGGVGLNLTAADHVFLLDPWWNPAAEDQAADRAHRIGQERPVIITKLVARDSVEEQIVQLQESKRRLAQAALGVADDATPSAATSLSRAELLSLLQA